MKTNHTTKLFFKKFKYKAVVTTPATGFIRYASRKDIDSLFNAERLEEWPGVLGPLSYDYSNFTIGSVHDHKSQRRKQIWDNRFTLYKLFNWISKNYETNTHKIRNEGDKLAFFTNDKTLWEDFYRCFKKEITELVWPKNDTHSNYLDENPNTVICKELPYGKYRYKINLRRHTSKISNFNEWIENYKGDLKASGNLQKGYWYDGKFLYSTNNEIMLLLTLYLGDAIRDVQQFKLEAEINENSTT